MQPYRAALGAEAVLVVDHVWTGKAILAVFVRMDRTVSDVGVVSLRYLAPDNGDFPFEREIHEVLADAYREAVPA